MDDSLEIADTFMAFVSPEFGVIDSYIESLTGITNANVENAPRLKQVLKAFVDWLPEEAILDSWSENDENQVRKELEKKEIVVEGLAPYLDSWI